MLPLSARLQYASPLPVRDAPPVHDDPVEALPLQRRAAPASARPGQALEVRTADRAERPGSAVAETPDPTYYAARQLDVYPALATPLDLARAGSAAAGIAGRALLLVLIDAIGIVNEVTVLEAEPATYFEDDARSALMSARFTPAYRNGLPVKSRMLVEITYGKELTE